MSAAAARRPASPYARRLARERGIALELMTGTGPGGRIVAADIESFLRTRRAEPGPVPAGTMRAIAAYSTAIDLRPLQALLAVLAESRATVTLDDMLLRAGAMALESMPARGPEGGQEIAVGIEIGGGADARQVVIADAHLGLVSALHVRLVAAIAAPGNAAASRAPLTLRRLSRRGVRPTAMPLLPGAAARLVVVAGAGFAEGEALLSFDAALVGEDDAAALLARFRDSLEAPLRLLA